MTYATFKFRRGRTQGVAGLGTLHFPNWSCVLTGLPLGLKPWMLLNDPASTLGSMFYHHVAG